MIKTVAHGQKVIQVKKLHSKTISFDAKPNCRDCKNSIVVNNTFYCGLYKYLNGDYIYSMDSRSDNNLCGPDGYYFKNSLKK